MNIDRHHAENPQLSCHHCTIRIEQATEGLPGVIAVEGNVEAKTATFTLESPEALEGVKETLAEIGYPAE